jgi:hypothetical protein
MSEYSAEAKRLETSKHGDKYETLQLAQPDEPVMSLSLGSALPTGFIAPDTTGKRSPVAEQMR